MITLQTYENPRIDEALFCEALKLYESQTHLFNKRVFVSTIETVCVDEFVKVLGTFSKTKNIAKTILLTMYPRYEGFVTDKQLIVYSNDSCVSYIPYVESKLEGKKSSPNFLYEFILETLPLKICLKILLVNKNIYSQNDQNIKFLKYKFEKICKLSTKNCGFNLAKTTKNLFSLHLISSKIQQYALTYQKLKKLYFKSIFETWPLPTDPEKHIYEDIAIASYLITLWDIQNDCEVGRSQELLPQTSQSRRNFLDLGCGNGVLTFLLTSEGFTGTGLDVRGRKTWPILKKLCPNLDIEEQSLDPSDPTCIFPAYDWIIGNHSDELTPWIPVLSARCDAIPTKRNKIFLLPCCPYDFYGKYERRDTSISYYCDYLSYLENMCSTDLGFQVRRDRLRIPSTKRICLVGTYSPENCSKSTSPLERLLKKGASKDLPFTPRPQVEPVRNCTQLDRNIVTDIVKKAFEAIIRADPSTTITLECYIQDGDVELCDSVLWQRGGTINISKFAELLNVEEKIMLKNQHGGLRTLFRNHQHIFTVRGDTLSLAFDEKVTSNVMDEVQNKNNHSKNLREILHKTKLCWFLTNHPQGCPYPSQRCRYAHGVDELKSPPPKKLH